MFVSLGYKTESAKHIAMICYGQGGHPIFYGLIKQVLDGCGSIQQGVLGMNMKMGKLGHRLLVGHAINK
jgi:hypothetical protein